LYLFLLDRPDVTGVYNAGFENLSIRSIADMICENLPAKINVKPSNDPRSYRINSDKLLATGFKPKKNVAAAISEIVAAYNSGALKDEDRWYCLKWMQAHVL
jgi:nucleoside-diphosphate-sugar epimerase